MDRRQFVRVIGAGGIGSALYGAATGETAAAELPAAANAATKAAAPPGPDDIDNDSLALVDMAMSASIDIPFL